MGQQRPEGGDPALSDMRTSVDGFGTRVRVEFNFMGDSLYAVSCNPEKLPSTKGDALFDRLVAFYSAKFGQAQVDDGQDDPYFVKSRDWQGPLCEIGVTNSIEGDMRQLGWGYQVPTNLHVKLK